MNIAHFESLGHLRCKLHLQKPFKLKCTDTNEKRFALRINNVTI